MDSPPTPDNDYDGVESDGLLGMHTKPFVDHSQPCSCDKSSSFLQWATILCFICTVLNLSLFLLPERLTLCHDPLADISKEQLLTLRRPSPYIGLNEIKRVQPPVPASIVNYPQVVAQVDAVQRSRVFDDDPLRYMSQTGTVSPRESRIRVAPSVSTLVQFRTIDYGMELCELVLQFSSRNNPAPFILSVHRLSSTTLIDTKILSYSTRPTRITTVGNIKVQGTEDVHWSRNFTCAWDELMTFELACSQEEEVHGGGCSLVWWQNELDEEPNEGIFMRQHATV